MALPPVRLSFKESCAEVQSSEPQSFHQFENKILESLRKPFSCKANLAMLQIDQINKYSCCWKNKLLPGGCSCVVGHGTGKHLTSLMNVGTVTSRGEQSSGGKILPLCRCLVSTRVKVSSSEVPNLFRLFRSLWQAYGKNLSCLQKFSLQAFELWMWSHRTEL